MTKFDVIILKDLEQKNKTSFLKSEKINNLTLVQKNVLKKNSVYKRIETLKNQELVDNGAKDGRSNTYYITKKGLEKLRVISEGETNNEK